MTEKVAQAPQRSYEIWGNWKMNPPSKEAAEKLFWEMAHERLKPLLADFSGVRNRIGIGIFAPDLFIDSLSTLLKTVEGLVQLGVQNMYFESEGAYTGESSAPMIRSMLRLVGSDPTVVLNDPNVLIGHSERRHGSVKGIRETNESINKKMLAAYEHAMRPFLAVGETLGEREEGLTEDVLGEQIIRGLEVVEADQFLSARTVIAYEPVWAIGTGKTATPEMANEAHSHIRGILRDMYGDEVADQTSIQYGGSMKPGNAAELLAQEHIDGGLIGGASLDAASFAGIVAAVPLLK
jgi:triosephosphate isomerase